MINTEGAPEMKGQDVNGKDTNGTDVNRTDVNGLSPGKRLSQGRLQLGLTQEQVAKELYITLVKIKALESDDYGRLNTDTFIRGYIRAYANLLKLDVLEILAAYDQLLQERNLQLVSQAGAGAGIGERQVAGKPAQPGSSPSRSALQLLLVIAAFFVGLWLISVWFFNKQSDNNYTTLAPVVAVYSSSDESESSDSPAGEARSSEAGDTMLTQSPLLPASAIAAAEIASSSSAKSRSAAASSLPPVSSQAALQTAITLSSAAASSLADTGADKPKSSGLDTISFTFRAECWLEVSDSRGDVLATELQGPGSSLTLVGKAPFDVKLGNAPAVAILLNSKKIDVIPLLGSNVLTLRVSNN